MKFHRFAVALLTLPLLLAACSTVPTTEHDKAHLRAEVDATIDKFTQRDPSSKHHFEDAYGYVVFPKVTKGGAGIGGAHARGILFKNGTPVAWADLSQGTLGFQLGGQTYREVIFFKNRTAYRTFLDGKMALSAQASAVAAEAGAAAEADYENGVMIMTMTRAGLMYEASVGGQKFSVVPMD